MCGLVGGMLVVLIRDGDELLSISVRGRSR